MTRTRIEIKAKILEESKLPIKPTHLMSKTNLAWNPLKKYADELIGKKLLIEIAQTKEEIRNDKRTKFKYQATDLSANVLTMFTEVKKYLE